MAQVAAAQDGNARCPADLGQSPLSRNLRSLERDGLVEMAAAGRDLRRRAVWLTEKGARDVEAALPIWRQAHEDLVALIDIGLPHRLADATNVLLVG
jgi:DNA-binding MarR family transcriptional regulator